MIHALDSLGPDDRFAVIAFATTPNRSARTWSPANETEFARRPNVGRKAQCGGGNRIADGSNPRAASDGKARGRTFQVVLLTDGLPTVGVTDPKKILENVNRQAGEERESTPSGLVTTSTHNCSIRWRKRRAVAPRMFARAKTWNRKCPRSRPRSTPGAHRPRARGSGRTHIVEMYPPRLPDLFHGEQLQVVGRYEGHGHATLTLTGRAGDLSSRIHSKRHSPRHGGPDFIAPSGPGVKLATCSTRSVATANQPK